MKIGEIARRLGAEVLVEVDLSLEATGCYVSDLLSDVLANSREGDLWITQHTHPNVVAVAAVKGLSGVVIVGRKQVEPETLERARTEGVNMIASDRSAFEAAGEVFNLLKAGAEG